MKRFLPDSIFARLFALAIGAVVISHVTTSLLLLNLFRGQFHHHPPPPVSPPAQAQHWSAPLEHAPPPMPRPAHTGMRPLPPGFWIGFGVQVIALSLAAWFGARMLARPIQRLAQAAAQLGENLNAPPIAESGPAEARQAAHVFNGMQQRIRSQIEERSRFLAAVSHDLRTPLTRMKLRVERLPQDAGREKLRDDIAEMAVMLDAALDYLRGAATPEASQLMDVQALMESMAEDAAENGKDVSVRGSARPLMTRPMALRRCLANLVENALRYGRKAGITLNDSSDRLVIEIRDDGPGIPEEKMGEVFEPFVRLESSRNKAFGGVGLGLSIAREAAEQCGGRLELRNADGGKGLIAAVTLPRSG